MSPTAKLRLAVLVSLVLWLLAVAASTAWRVLSAALTGHTLLMGDVVSSWA